jgi:hypothetical protein
MTTVKQIKAKIKQATIERSRKRRMVSSWYMHKWGAPLLPLVKAWFVVVKGPIQ